jgi:hypothetical protein
MPREANIDTTVIGEKQRTLDQIDITDGDEHLPRTSHRHLLIDSTNVNECKWIVGHKVKPCDDQSGLPTLRLHRQMKLFLQTT